MYFVFSSNPIWLEQYQENGWPRESETDRYVHHSCIYCIVSVRLKFLKGNGGNDT